ncbi:cell wall-binding repeat-containing protein [Salisediminibacterium beveridgei]|uniref:SCP domain-containing protein n=1 Tax=Salisediminibacterium beveridgei TaxID=632773 RepID=A0A1D7QRQ9_9BACI|nr:cell wall-binding repeat-containing protein [Salisediminibacterium beveridgei]AOM81680.1 conserved hypothetical protein with cell wall binding domains [Salisediminibacterium beveridgei]
MKGKLSFVALSLLLVISLFASPAFAEESNRIAGDNRFETAVEVSKTGWEDGADHVVLTTGMAFPDALAATPLASELDAPILLTGPTTLHAAAEAEIERLDPDHVTIIGGELAVSEDIQTVIEDMDIEVDRIGGDNRFHTAHLIALELLEVSENDPERAVLATGMDFPDALAVAPYAAEKGYPILLTLPDRLHPETIAALDAVENEATYVIGGDVAISKNAENEVKGTTERIAGDNRYETAGKLIDRLMGDWGKDVYVATGQEFPDSLAGSVLAAKEEVPVFLTLPDRVNETVLNSMNQFGVKDFTLLGGEVALNSDVESTLNNLLLVDGDFSEVTSQGFDLFQLINHERTNAELDALRLNVELTGKADFWSEYMMEKDFLDTSSSENTFDDILEKDTDFEAENASVNTQHGLYPAKEVMDYWLAGSQSKENLMNEDATHVGVGFAYDDDRPDATLKAPFWTSVFYEYKR